VVVSPRASRDLRAIYDRIAEATSPEVAGQYVLRITDHLQSFELASERGSRRDDVRRGLRVVGFERRIAIAFTVTEREVTIQRVFYGGQNWRKAF
jgi:toxin ParE1/3/4